MRKPVLMMMKRHRQYGQHKDRQEKDRQPCPVFTKAICNPTNHHDVRSYDVTSVEL